MGLETSLERALEGPGEADRAGRGSTSFFMDGISVDLISTHHPFPLDSNSDIK